MVSIPIIETVASLIQTGLTDGGLPALVLLMTIESFGLPPLPSEIILPFAGFLVATGNFSFAGAMIAAMIGGLIGSYIAYAIGRWGRHLISGPERRWYHLDPRHLEQMDGWFLRRGEITVLLARLMPVIRSYISYPAGTAKMEPVRFGVFTAIGAFPFTLALIYAGFVLKAEWTNILPIFHLLDYAAAALVVLGAIYLLLRWRNVIPPGLPPWRSRPDATPPANAP